MYLQGSARPVVVVDVLLLLEYGRPRGLPPWQCAKCGHGVTADTALTTHLPFRRGCVVIRVRTETSHNLANFISFSIGYNG